MKGSVKTLAFKAVMTFKKELLWNRLNENKRRWDFHLYLPDKVQTQSSGNLDAVQLHSAG
ncbi:hypothetical protein RvY_11111 [Ramazzottius varieornatus]|uniref:Uncharacterized protein n=1 Tax=Ramazzottius varieornatus TaxID=947166 RepID=A0A1D1VNY0_RAMVA|nr:hypothetical protein RvY_11111 [Ramazzottius varieornatus]